MSPILTGSHVFSDEQLDYDRLRHELLQRVVQGVLADADVRSGLLATDRTAGWDGHFYIQSADGNQRLELSGQIQSQYIFNHRTDSGDDDSRGGFQLRRLKFKTNGHLFDPSLQYVASFNAGGSGSTATLSDGYIAKSFESGMTLKVGQFKPPFLVEQLTSSKRQLAVDRSLLANSAVFNQGRSLGIQLSRRGDRIHWAAMYHIGFGLDNTKALTENTEYAFAARLEFLAAGSWSQFDDYSSWPDESFAARLGTAINLEKDEYGTSAGPEQRRLALTADVSLEFGGANLFAAVLAQQSRADDAPDLDRFGVVVQGGLFLTDDLEVFGRYEWGDLDEPGVVDLSLLTVGFTRFFSRHNLKWTTDVGYGFDEVATEWEKDNLGWQADAAGESGQVVIRTLVQLLF